LIETGGHINPAVSGKFRIKNHFSEMIAYIYGLIDSRFGHYWQISMEKSVAVHYRSNGRFNMW